MGLAETKPNLMGLGPGPCAGGLVGRSGTRAARVDRAGRRVGRVVHMVRPAREAARFHGPFKGPFLLGRTFHI